MTKKLWVPDEKIPDRVRQMAWTMFLEQWKSGEVGEGDEEVQRAYGKCLDVARTVFKIETGAVK